MGWAAVLAECWDEDVGAPAAGGGSLEQVRHVPKWQLALGILDELIGWGLERRVVQADGGYGDITAFRVGLEDGELEYVFRSRV